LINNELKQEIKRRNNMRLLVGLLGCFFLASCAGPGTQIQAECETKFREFPEIFNCTYENIVSKHPDILQNARAKLYLLRGEQLFVQVLEKKITSLDAKVSWQKLFVELKSAHDQEVAAVADSITRSLDSVRVPLLPVNNRINCTSNKVGSSIYITCQ
jgi:hypothetical protein